jgi:glycolate oxidase FAD binding subunit
VTAADLSQALQRVLPPSALLEAAESYGIDGRAPALAVRPQSEEQLLEVLRACNARAAAVVPWGGGTHMSLGTPPERYDLAVDLTALGGALEYEPADLTVSVRAGMRLAELQRLLGEHGQWLTLDPPADADATIGGVLAVNASGPGRVVYGTARDLLIGIAVASPEGELIRSGGRVVKNVAGYDLGKLHIGALGTLGIITRASFKVAPLPEVMRSVAFASADPKALLAIAGDARRRGLALNRLTVTGAVGGDWRLLVRLAGGAAAVDGSQRQLEGLAAGTGLSLAPAEEADWQSLPAYGAANEVRTRAGVLPSSAGGVMERLAGLDAGMVAYPTVGIVYGAWPAGGVGAQQLLELRRYCVEAGRGALVLEKAPAELRAAVDVWGEPRPDFALMRRLKQQFDPQGILNPGRFVGGV